MHITRFLAAVLFAVLIAAPGASADSVRLTTQKEPKVDPELRVTTDTMKRVSWEKKDGADRETRYPWEVDRYSLNRGRKDCTNLETAWNRVLSAGANGTWSTVDSDISGALEIKVPKPYELEAPHIKVRMLYYHLRASVEQGKDPATAWNTYVTENMKYATEAAKDRGNAIGKPFPGGAFKGADMGAVHSTTVLAFIAMAIHYRKQGDPNKAYAEGYKAAADLCEQLGLSTGKNEYIERYSIPFLRDASAMYGSGDNPDWTAAAGVYDVIYNLCNKLKDSLGANRAKMESARCKINTGETGAAQTVYKKAIDEYEATAGGGKPPVKGWLTPEKAAYYAAAYAGMGHVCRKQNKHSEALKYFGKGLGLFSSDLEVRADALLHAGYSAVEVGKESKAAKSGYYWRLGVSYLVELKDSLADTKAAKDAVLLNDALNTIKPKDAH